MVIVAAGDCRQVRLRGAARVGAGVHWRVGSGGQYISAASLATASDSVKGFDPIVGVALQLGELFGVRAARRFPFGPSGVVDLAVGLVEIAAQPSCCVAFSVRGGLGGGFAGQKISFLAVACARSAWSSASQSPHSVAAARRSASVSSSRYCRRRDDETINETKRNYETKRHGGRVGRG